MKKNIYIYLTAFLLIFLVCTNNHLTIKEAINNGYSDIKSYLHIANHQEYNSQEYYPFHHLERWPIHKLVGFLSRISKAKIHKTYQFSIFFVAFIFILSIQNMNVSNYHKVAILTLILYHPYLFRLYLTIPEMIADASFMLGTLLFINSIHKKYLLIISIFIMSLSRQTSLLIIPVCITLMLFKKMPRKNVILTCALIIIINAVMRLFTQSLFPENPDNGYIYDQIFNGWSFNDDLVDRITNFIPRYLYLLFTLIPIFIFNNDINFFKKNLPFFLAFLIFNAQPLIMGPMITGGNIQRLSALGIPFLIPVLIKQKLNKEWLAFFILFFVALSMHHNFSFIFELHHKRLVYLIIVLATFLISFTYVLIKKNEK